MKHLKLFLSLIIISVTFISCEKENEKEEEIANVVLPIKIIKTGPEGEKTTSILEYTGSKIKKITETSDLGSTVFTFTYTGENITKIVESNKNGIVKSQSFLFGGEKLDKLLMWSENYETDSEACFYCETVASIEYNADGNQTIKYRYGKNEEVINEVKVTYQDNKLLIMTDKKGITKGFRYDAYENLWFNPFGNIMGWNRLELVDPLKYSKKNISAFANEDIQKSEGYNVVYYKGGSSNLPNLNSTYPDEVRYSTILTNISHAKIEYFYNKLK